MKLATEWWGEWTERTLWRCRACGYEFSHRPANTEYGNDYWWYCRCGARDWEEYRVRERPGYARLENGDTLVTMWEEERV